MSELTLSTIEGTLSTSTMPSPNPATPPKNGACLWWALPKEISDEILQLAYGTPNKPISMLDKRAFGSLQLDKKFGRDDEKKPFEVSSCIPSAESSPILHHVDTSPLSTGHRLTSSTQPRQYERYIDRLLVSKKWLHEATEALFTSTPVAINESDGTFFNLNPQVSLAHQRPFPGLSLVTAVHITSLDQAAMFARLLATQCPRLRRLHVQDSSSDIFVRPGHDFRKPDWGGRWTEENVRGSRWFGAVAVLSGLESVSLEISDERCGIPFFEARSCGCRFMAANWGLVRRLFVESATRARDPAATQEGRTVGRLRVPKRKLSC
jgi:hypothetical protein